ncbi:MAG: NAD(P)/FAD-dependent oxidoreductase [Lachnospiraceae bacterium]|jgi:nitrite reductase (NADH) large subunit|nr:NAD(P)/FAD-dependent oxidoreductase [Lachnospiraceae bacterium]
MKYVIIGAGVAGVEGAKVIRSHDKEGEILMVSADTQIHSRCMLHKFISGERDEKGLDFTEEGFFEQYRIGWKKGVKVQRIDTEKREVYLDTGEAVSYDKLLLACGADSFIPPVGQLREASNVYGLRNLSDAQAIVAEAKKANQVLVIGSGLVGLDAAYGLLERGKQITVVEMANQILPVQLDANGAKAYQEKFEQAGVRFVLGRKASEAQCGEDGRIHKVTLDNGESIPCDMVIVAAGVRPALGCLKDSSIDCGRGVTVDASMKTSAEDVYAAGDITGLSGIWPNAADQGRIAGRSMCGIKDAYTDTYAVKNTINFFGLVTLCVGKIRPEEGDFVQIREDRNQYKRVIEKDGKVEGILLQGDISHAGFWQYLIKNRIDISGIQKDIFAVSYADFYQIGERGKYEWRQEI